MRSIILSSTLALLAVLVVACTQGNEQILQTSFFEPEHTLFELTEQPYDSILTIRASDDMTWMVTRQDPEDAKWLNYSTDPQVGEGAFEFSVAENTGKSERKAVLTLRGIKEGSQYMKVVNITITQMGQDAYMFLDNVDENDFTNISCYGSSDLTVNIRSNVDWTATAYLGSEGEESAEDWVTITKGKSGSKHGTVKFNVAPNDVKEVKTGRIVITGVRDEFKETLIVPFSQAAQTGDIVIRINRMTGVLKDGDAVLTLKNAEGEYTNVDVIVKNETSGTLIILKTDSMPAGVYTMTSVIYEGDNTIILDGLCTFTDGSQIAITERWDSDFMMFGGENAKRPLVLSTVDQLQKLSDLVNSGKGFSGLYLALDNDINLNTVASWKPIGWASGDTEYYAFKGCFDGRNHSVINLHITEGTTKGQGLFGIVEGTEENIAVIENLIVKGKSEGGYDIDVTGGGNGSLIGAAIDYVKINNCYGYASIRGKGGATGGLIGHTGALNFIVQGATAPSDVAAKNIVISNSHNRGSKVTVYNETDNSALFTNQNGGFIGCLARGAKVLYCSNTADVATEDNNSRLGGFVGFLNGMIDQCYNTGNITGGTKNQGGLIGWFGRTGKLSNSYNTGDLDFDSNDVAGLIGGFVGNMKTDFFVKYCYTAGDFKTNAAGFVGTLGTGSNNKDINATTFVRNYCVRSTNRPKNKWGAATPIANTAAMADFLTSETSLQQSSYISWDFDNIWVMDNKAGSGMPVLKNNQPIGK